MLNIYEHIRTSLHYNKFLLGPQLFVEYNCPIEEEDFGFWTPADYFIHVLSGKKTWRKGAHKWTVERGQTLYVKKGAYVIEQFFADEFCSLVFFVTDDFVAATASAVADQIAELPAPATAPAAVLAVEADLSLATYFQSMLAFFSSTDRPADSLLGLKMRELIINILLNPGNIPLSAYLLSLAGSKTWLPHIMEANFHYNLSLEDYARLCGRSLASFKRDFKKEFAMPPGKWLKKKRLGYASTLLARGDLNISQICLECGFEDLSHFSRAFKEAFSLSPTRYREEFSETT